MNDLIEQAKLLIMTKVRQRSNWQTEDDAALATLSPIGSPFTEGDTPLFI